MSRQCRPRIRVCTVCHSVYRKNPKKSDTRKKCCNYPKIGTVLFYYRVMSPKDADGMANSVDPDQTQGTVWSGSTLFAQTCLSENLRSLRYIFWTQYCMLKFQDSHSIFGVVQIFRIWWVLNKEWFGIEGNFCMFIWIIIWDINVNGDKGAVAFLLKVQQS